MSDMFPEFPSWPKGGQFDESVAQRARGTYKPQPPPRGTATAQPAPKRSVKEPPNPLRLVRAVAIFFLVISLAAVVNFTATTAWDVTRHDDRAMMPALIAVACLLLTLLCLWGIRKLDARLRDQ